MKLFSDSFSETPIHFKTTPRHFPQVFNDSFLSADKTVKNSHVTSPFTVVSNSGNSQQSRNEDMVKDWDMVKSNLFDDGEDAGTHYLDTPKTGTHYLDTPNTGTHYLDTPRGRNQAILGTSLEPGLVNMTPTNGVSEKVNSNLLNGDNVETSVMKAAVSTGSFDWLSAVTASDQAAVGAIVEPRRTTITPTNKLFESMNSSLLDYEEDAGLVVLKTPAGSTDWLTEATVKKQVMPDDGVESHLVTLTPTAVQTTLSEATVYTQEATGKTKTSNDLNDIIKRYKLLKHKSTRNNNNSNQNKPSLNSPVEGNLSVTKRLSETAGHNRSSIDTPTDNSSVAFPLLQIETPKAGLVGGNDALARKRRVNEYESELVHAYRGFDSSASPEDSRKNLQNQQEEVQDRSLWDNTRDLFEDVDFPVATPLSFLQKDTRGVSQEFSRDLVRQFAAAPALDQAVRPEKTPQRHMIDVSYEPIIDLSLDPLSAVANSTAIDPTSRTPMAPNSLPSNPYNEDRLGYTLPADLFKNLAISSKLSETLDESYATTGKRNPVDQATPSRENGADHNYESPVGLWSSTLLAPFKTPKTKMLDDEDFNLLTPGNAMRRGLQMFGGDAATSPGSL